MPITQRIASLWRNLLWRRTVDRELDDELQSHVELLVAEKIDAGMPPDEARRTALVEMGGVTQVREEVRAARSGSWLTGLVHDFRFAWRQMARTPVFTAVAVGLLGLGIGLDAGLLTVVEGVYVRPAPGVGDTDGLVWIRSNFVHPLGGNRDRGIRYSAFLAYRDQTATFSNIAAWSRGGVDVDVGSGPFRAGAHFVSGSYFATFRLPMTLGSGFVFSDEPTPEPLGVAVISHRYWVQRLGSDPAVVGRQVRVSANRDYGGREIRTIAIPVTVLGVLPERFNGPQYNMEDSYDIWLPMGLYPLLYPRASSADAREEREWLTLAARLHPSASVERASNVVSVVAAQLITEADRERPAARVFAEPLGAWDKATPGLAAVVAAIAALFLIITCSNLSSMLLGRAVARRHEIGVRLSLGASRWRLVRQLLTESVVLALLSGVLAAVVLFWLLEAAGALIFPVPPDLSPDWSVAVFSMTIALVTGLVFGLVPALHATRASVSEVLKAALPSGGARRSRLQGAFVAIQLAVSLPLLFGAAAIVISLRIMLHEPLGYDATAEVITARIDADDVQALERNLTAAKPLLAAIPGVTKVAFASSLPPGESDMSATFNPPGGGRRRIGGFSRPDDEPGFLGGRYLANSVAWVDADYFAAIGIAIRRGRGIAASDVAGTAFVVVVSEDFARLVWPGEDPIGKTLVRGRGIGFGGARSNRSSGRDTLFTVVGVASSVVEYDDEAPAVYVPRLQRAVHDTGRGPARTEPRVALVVRVATPGFAIPVAIRRELTRLDPTLTVSAIESLADRRARQFEGFEKGMWGALASGVLMLVLSSVGIYAIVAFGVSQRTREIGVRMALGARGAQVVRMFVKQGLILATIGLITGVPLVIAVMKLGPGDIGGFSMFRLNTVIGISIVLLIVTAIASWIPARSAARVNPVDALRND
jgi:predicted permease